MPHITLNLNDDDEFRSCQFCHSPMTIFHNATTRNHKNSMTLSFDQTNCEKCGKFIEILPEIPEDEGLLFVCSHSECQRQCLCFECGLLYDLKAPECVEEDTAGLVFHEMDKVLVTASINSVDPKDILPVIGTMRFADDGMKEEVTSSSGSTVSTTDRE